MIIRHTLPYGVFTLPDTDPYTDSDNVQKGYTGTETYGDSDAKP